MPASWTSPSTPFAENAATSNPWSPRTCSSACKRSCRGEFRAPRPQQRAHPDFPLRAFVRCESCGRGLTGSWSKGRSEYYAYYHCRPGCRAVNVTKAKLEGLFADELALLQPTSGYMRLFKESVLQIWKARKAAVREELAAAERAAKTIQDKLDRLDEAFLFERSIEIETYDRHAEKLREELTLARIDRHSGQLDELDGRQLEPSRFTRRSAPGTR
jgi:recombinase-like zinc beta ribbon protein